MTVHRGGCHCGCIAFDVEGDIGQVIDCNCSLCGKRAALHWFVPRTQLRLITPCADLTEYAFGSGKIRHYFCSACGCAPFGEGKDKAGAATAAVNVRCLEGVDIATLKVHPFDGRSL